MAPPPPASWPPTSPVASIGRSASNSPRHSSDDFDSGSDENYGSGSGSGTSEFYIAASQDGIFPDKSPSAEDGAFQICDEDVFDPKYQSVVKGLVADFLREIADEADWNKSSLVDRPDIGGLRVQTCTRPEAPFGFRIQVDRLGGSAAEAFSLFSDLERRKEWDAMCQSVAILKTIDPLTFVYHLRLKAAWPTSPRDACLLVAFRALQDGSFVSVGKSIEDDALCPPDPTGTFVRMHTRLSGNLFLPNSTDSSTFKLLQLIDADPRGSIPSYVIKAASAKSFPQTVQSIENAITKQANPRFYSELIERLRKSKDKISKTAETNEDNLTTLKEIKARLDSIEDNLQCSRPASSKFSQFLRNWGPFIMSSLNFVLLMHLVGGKQKNSRQ